MGAFCLPWCGLHLLADRLGRPSLHRKEEDACLRRPVLPRFHQASSQEDQPKGWPLHGEPKSTTPTKARGDRLRAGTEGFWYSPSCEKFGRTYATCCAFFGGDFDGGGGDSFAASRADWAL